MQETKKNFILGIIAGVAVISTVVSISLVIVLLKGEPIRSSQASSQKEVVADDIFRPSEPTPTGVDIQVNSSDHIRGDINAPVTIVEFSDFQCPFCLRFHDTLKQVMADYPDEVRWVYKHFPLDSIHPYSRKAAEASECADEQDKFWQYADELFTRQSEISPSIFEEIAKDIGLNVNKFNECLDSGKYASKVEKDYQDGIKAGVRGTPGNFINGQSVPGAIPYEQVKIIIDSIL